MATVVFAVSRNWPSTVMVPPSRMVIHRHSHEPAAGSIRTHSPWSVPTTFESLSSYTSLWNVRRSPVLSPGSPMSTTVSVVACSITCTLACPCLAERAEAVARPGHDERERDPEGEHDQRSPSHDSPLPPVDVVIVAVTGLHVIPAKWPSDRRGVGRLGTRRWDLTNASLQE